MVAHGDAADVEIGLRCIRFHSTVDNGPSCDSQKLHRGVYALPSVKEAGTLCMGRAWSAQSVMTVDALRVALFVAVPAAPLVV